MIRLAKIDDVDYINELGLLLNDNFKDTYDIKKYVDNQIDKVFVFEDEQIKGFIIIEDLEEEIDILSIVVNPKYRRNHIATNLIDYVISNAKMTQKQIILEVASKNEGAINLYNNFGFKAINIRKNYYKDDDAIIMVRGLY